jgi:hypothetical protein
MRRRHVPNADGFCRDGDCTYTCHSTFDDCNTNLAADGCVTDLQHFGACNNPCDPVNGVGSCEAGTSTIASCNSDFANCDSDPATSCEVNTRIDPQD